MADPLDHPDVTAALRLIVERDRARPGPTCPRCGRRAVNRNSKKGWCYRCEQEYEDTLREGKRRWAQRQRDGIDASATVATDADDATGAEHADDATGATRAVAAMTELLPVTEVATRLGVSRDTVYRLLDDGQLRGVRIRGQRRVVASSLDQWLASLLEPEVAE